MASLNCLRMIPEGWLINPAKTWLIRFHKCPTSLQRLPKVYMDKWSVTSQGTPLNFINRRKVELNPALETWTELTLNGWENLEQQFGDSALTNIQTNAKTSLPSLEGIHRNVSI